MMQTTRLEQCVWDLHLGLVDLRRACSANTDIALIRGALVQLTEAVVAVVGGERHQLWTSVPSGGVFTHRTGATTPPHRGVATARELRAFLSATASGLASIAQQPVDRSRVCRWADALEGVGAEFLRVGDMALSWLDGDPDAELDRLKTRYQEELLQR